MWVKTKAGKNMPVDPTMISYRRPGAGVKAKFTDIRNVGAAIHSMIENAAQKMDDCGFTEEGEWTYLAKLFGSNAVPGESASVIQQAIKKAEKEGTITSKNRWQLIEYLCADYLSGR